MLLRLLPESSRSTGWRDMTGTDLKTDNKPKINPFLKISWIAGAVTFALMVAAFVCLNYKIYAAGILVLPFIIYLFATPSLFIIIQQNTPRL